MRDDGGQRLQVELLFPMIQHGMPILRHHRLNLRIASDAQIVPNPSQCHLLQLAGVFNQTMQEIQSPIDSTNGNIPKANEVLMDSINHLQSTSRRFPSPFLERLPQPCCNQRHSRQEPMLGSSGP